MRRRFLVALLVALPFAGAGNVAAHPLGNFSISQYSAIRIDKNSIDLRYLIDLAEIPTFQEIQENGMAPRIGDATVEKYVARTTDTLRENLWLEVNGQRIALQAESRDIIFPSGVGGLPTMKIGVVYKSKLDAVSAATPQTLYYRDGNFSDRAGWKEIIAVPGNGAELLNSSVPEKDRSSQLSDYPTDLLNSPPQVLEARITFSLKENPAPVAVAATTPVQARPAHTKDETEPTASENLNPQRPITKPVAEPKTESQTPVNPENDGAELPTASRPIQLRANKQAIANNSFSDLIATKHPDWSMVLLAFLIAAALGAFHALEPGHGKTLVAAYLVGSRGTMRHALTLGLIVTAAHTAGVYLLGGITLYASHYIVPEKVYPWLGLASGVMIMGLGSVLFLRSYRSREGAPHHYQHDHGDHHHHSNAGHSHHRHEHDRTVSLRDLLTLGISGGIVPCPAALVVLLSAISMQRVGFGLLLIFAFSAGLALVLITIGSFMVYAQRFMSRFQANSRLTSRWLPLTSSVFITLVGVTLTWRAIQTTGLVALIL